MRVLHTVSSWNRKRIKRRTNNNKDLLESGLYAGVVLHTILPLLFHQAPNAQYHEEKEI